MEDLECAEWDDAQPLPAPNGINLNFGAFPILVMQDVRHESRGKGEVRGNSKKPCKVT